MLKKFKLFQVVLVGALLLAGCAGEDGEPGPAGATGAQGTQGDKGEQGNPGADAVGKVGFIEGTITGARRDGTPLNEPFKYEYTFGVESFIQDGRNSGYLDVQRFATAAGAIMAGTIYDSNDPFVNPPDDKGFFKMILAPSFENPGVLGPVHTFLTFYKELDNTKLLKITANPNTQIDPINYNSFLPISVEVNGKYNFKMAVESNDYEGYQVDTNDDFIPDAVEFYASKNISAVYDLNTGALLYITKNSPDQVTTGTVFDLYNEVKYIYDGTMKEYYFVLAADDSPLYEEVGSVDPDVISIENYQQVDGVISFDFEITVSKYSGVLGASFGWVGWRYYGKNSTAHDLTITGTYSSGEKVYDEIIYRKKN